MNNSENTELFLNNVASNAAMEILALRRDISVAFGLVRHKRNPTIPHNLDIGENILLFRPCQPHGHSALFNARNAFGSFYRADLSGNGGGIRSVLGRDLTWICLNELSCRTAKCDYERGRHALLDQRLPRFLDHLELLQ